MVTEQALTEAQVNKLSRDVVYQVTHVNCSKCGDSIPLEEGMRNTLHVPDGPDDTRPKPYCDVCIELAEERGYR